MPHSTERRQIPKERKLKILAEVAAGANIAKLEKRHKLNTGQIYQWRKSLMPDLELSGRSAHSDEKKIAAVKRVVLGNEKPSVVARDVQISTSQMSKWVERFGDEVRFFKPSATAESPRANGHGPVNGNGDAILISSGQERSDRDVAAATGGNGDVPRNTRSRVSDADKAAYVARLNAGESVSVLAAEAKVSDATIYAWRNKVNSQAAKAPASVGNDVYGQYNRLKMVVSDAIAWLKAGEDDVKTRIRDRELQEEDYAHRLMYLARSELMRATK